MDPVRGNYQEDTESRRYRGDHQRAEGQTWFDSGGDEGYRYPDRHGGGRAAYGAPPGAIGQVGPPLAEHRPQLPPENVNRDPAPQWDPGAVPSPTTRESRRAGARSAAQPVGARIGRSAMAALLTIVVVVAEVPVARVLLAGAFGPTRSTGAVVSGLLLLLGLPLGAAGLHGLTGEAAKAEGPVAAWLRPPVAYLAVALVLFLAAGLAA